MSLSLLSTYATSDDDEDPSPSPPSNSSFFSSLPQPQTQSLPKPKLKTKLTLVQQAQFKKIVNFVPPNFNMNFHDEDEDEEEEKGEDKPVLGSGGFGGGVSFFDSLPKPKKSLGGLGGGSGRRSVVEAEGMSGVGNFKPRKEIRGLNSGSGDALPFGGSNNGSVQWSNMPKPGGGGGREAVVDTAAGLIGNEGKKSEFSAKVDAIYQSSNDSSSIGFVCDNNESLTVKDETIEGSEGYGNNMHYENYPSYDSNNIVGYDQPAESYRHYENYPSNESGGGVNVGYDRSVVIEGNVRYGNYEGSGGGSYGGYGGSIGGMADPMMGKRRRRDVIPDDIVEVKQDELMKNRPKEDNAKLTGIAFGPSYQPAPSAKGKPSKLHKRKHQIGSLYYDMRSKEAELADRRAKGFLTKAETHAKYGW